MLIAIKHYLQSRQHVSLQDLALHFETTPDAMRGMLETWIKKGKVRQCSSIHCGGCSSGCSTAQDHEAYEWVNEEGVPVTFLDTPTRFKKL